MRSSVGDTAASNLRAELARQNKKKSEMALLLGISPAAVTRRVSGETALDVNEVVALAEWLDIPVTDLIGGTAYRPTTDRSSGDNAMPAYGPALVAA